MSQILIIYTGGTIGMMSDPTLSKLWTMFLSSTG